MSGWPWKGELLKRRGDMRVAEEERRYARKNVQAL
jgi:hypothetical protein